MTAVKDFIVAIELGSSKITGIAGKKNSDGSIQVLAYAREEASAFIRKGIIYNIPGKGKVTISFQGKTFYDKELPVTQFGVTEVLVEDLFNKKVNTRVIFNPQTGSITKIDKDI